MHKAGVDNILREYPDAKVIFTADNGITAHEAIEYAKSRGFKVIVTDHHEPAQTLPGADAIIDPKRQENADFRDYCGAGVAFLVMLELCKKTGRDLSIVTDTLDMVALATVADVVPLTGDNRAIVKAGLERINKKVRPMFRHLAEANRVTEASAHYTIAYLYGPLVNAPSRLDRDVGFIVEAFLSDDGEKIRACIAEMARCNEMRKRDTEKQTKLALEQVGKMMHALPPVIVLFLEEFDEGVVGLIAGRIADRFHRPAVVFACGAEEGVLKGSCRSIAAFPIHEVLGELAAEGILLSHGGHSMAAGLSIKRENFELFRDKIIALGARRLRPKDFRPRQAVDLSVRPEELTAEAVRSLSLLEPFGEGFPPPLFELTGFERGRARRIGKGRRHLKVTFENLNLLFWNDAGEAVQAMACGSCVGVPEVSEWRGMFSVDFMVKSGYNGLAPTLLCCQNGELVEVVDMEDEFVCVDYRGKVHRVSMEKLGKTLLPFDAFAQSDGNPNLRCEGCLLLIQGRCAGKSEGICEFYQNLPSGDKSGYYRARRAELSSGR
jgi:single-stranded-DNA-specific exonuclease